MENNSIKNKIAWKIYFIWLFKRVLPLFVLEVILLILVLFFLGKLVFVQKVFENAFLASAQNPISLAVYMFGAFWKTSILKKLTILGILSLGVLFMRDIGRIFNSYITTSKVAKH